ncbi:MFS transporter [Paucibacter sp. APW11]|uniref:MFS transporter n=1 Tax=Roseateles aquae TaxID=3077235 RepID=A0ABU3PEC2_9BURK|nr:MFS transporter [Paucibacter sp. APW11]MDT9000909.1 MFS transporter [Paucibacter sp. APW11]
MSLPLAPELQRRLIRPFQGLPPSVYIQVVATLINTMGGIAKLFLPLFFLERYQISYGQIGLLMSCYGIGAFGGSYLGGVLSDKFDNRGLAAVLLTASGALTISLALPLPLWLFFPLLALTGLADGSFRPCNMRLVLEPCSAADQPTAQGLYRMAYNLGTALAGITGGLLAGFGYHWVFVAQGCASLLASVWVRLAYRRLGGAAPVHHAQRAGESAALASPWRDPAFLRFIVGMLLIVGVFDQMYGTLGLFLSEHFKLGPQWVGYMFTINGLMVVGLQVWIARRIHRWGLLRCSQIAVLLIGAAFLLLNAGRSVLWPLLCVVVLTIGELLISPSYSAIVMQCSEGRQRGRYLGIYSAAWGGRTLYAPAAGTWLYGSLGGAQLWWVCAAIGVLTALMLQRPLGELLRRESSANVLA